MDIVIIGVLVNATVYVLTNKWLNIKYGSKPNQELINQLDILRQELNRVEAKLSAVTIKYNL